MNSAERDAELYGKIRATLQRIADPTVRKAWRDFFANKVREAQGRAVFNARLRVPETDDERGWIAGKTAHMHPSLAEAHLVLELDGMRFMVSPMLETCVILAADAPPN